jgi:hypothetical protein
VITKIIRTVATTGRIVDPWRLSKGATVSSPARAMEKSLSIAADRTNIGGNKDTAIRTLNHGAATESSNAKAGYLGWALSNGDRLQDLPLGRRESLSGLPHASAGTKVRGELALKQPTGLDE